MTPEDQIHAIAAVTGWTHLKKGLHGLIGMKPGHTEVSAVPDYLGDLNSCAEFERTLVKEREKAELYLRILKHVAGLDDYRDILFATAAQRAEAFLRTKGLWKD